MPLRLFLLLFALQFVSLSYAQDLDVQPLSVSRGKVIAPVNINGIGPHAFILDSGVSRTVISTELAEFLNLQPTAPPVNVNDSSGRAICADVVRADSFSCGTSATEDVQMLSMDLRPFVRNLGIPIGGIFSGRELAPGMFINLAHKKLILVPRDTAPLESGPGTVQFDLNNRGMPVVPVLLDGSHILPAILDLSFAGTFAMPRHALVEAGLMADETRKLTVKTGSAQSLSPDGLIQVRAQSLRVANQELLRPVITGESDSEPVRLGLGYLRHFELSLDYRSRLARFLPTDDTPAIDPDIFGVGVTPAALAGVGAEGAVYWTIWVAANSPADRIGIQPGATLTAIDGKDAGGLSHADLLKQLAVQPSKELSLTIRQGTQPRTVVLVSEKLL